MSGNNTSPAGGGSAPASATFRNEPAGGLARQIWLLAVRRRYLINKPRQLRTVAILLAMVLAFLVLINVILYAQRTHETELLVTAAPELAEVLAAYDRNELLLSLLGSVVVLVGVAFVAIIETHRTAGAAFNVARRLQSVAEGKLSTRLNLRRGDNLHELVAPFNALTEMLCHRAEEDASTLERVADQLDGAADRNEAAAAAAELRRLAAEKRRSLEEQ